jgi:hypothetical protein
MKRSKDCLGFSRVAVLSPVPHSVRYSLVRFNRDAVASDSQGLPRYAATPGSKPTAVRTPAGLRQHVEAVPHATEPRTFRHPCQMRIIAHALVQCVVKVLRSSLSCRRGRLPVADNE